MSYEMARMTNIGTDDEPEFRIEEFCVVEHLEDAFTRSGMTAAIANPDRALGEEFSLVKADGDPSTNLFASFWNVRKRRERLGGEPGPDPVPSVGSMVERALQNMLKITERR